MARNDRFGEGDGRSCCPSLDAKMADQSEDEAVAPTQVAQPAPSSLHDKRDRPEPVYCAVCSIDLTAWAIGDRAVHLNACLDATALEERYDCPTCGKELTDYNEQRRMAHVNLCLDRSVGQRDIELGDSGRGTEETDGQQNQAQQTAATSHTKRARDGADATEGAVAFVCKICGVDLSSSGLGGRIRHVKQCGQRFGVRPSDMAELQKIEQEEAIGVRLEGQSEGNTPNETESGRPNAFALMMQATTAVLDAKKRRVGGNRSWGWNGGASQRRRVGFPDFKRIRGTSPPFIVDGFQYASKENSSIYFLTHFHSDHYGGLSKSFDCGIIYCNEITAQLVVQELGINNKYVHPVAMNTPVLVGDVQVTFMDANHCPGAAIILFRLKNGKTYLHTGDFRFHKRMLSYAPLQSYVSKDTVAASSSPQRLDGVYLDTTYCDPKYTFPTQQTAIDHALTLMDKHFAHEKVLFLFGSYSLGKERLFMDIARKFQQKVCVLHVVPMQDLQMDNLSALLMKHRLRFRQIVAFRPTGWTFSNKSASLSTCRTDPTGKIRVYGIPYSEHSSFAELCEFVQVVNPHAIIPTVRPPPKELTSPSPLMCLPCQTGRFLPGELQFREASQEAA
ncbi:hypothetical protein BBJ28_00005060 [Nothophytophthora sp. Chile5]|nr:hypothetical protein BBJ28_00005060 [Nothophytophthora sp. Chile5]